MIKEACVRHAVHRIDDFRYHKSFFLTGLHPYFDWSFRRLPVDNDLQKCLNLGTYGGYYQVKPLGFFGAHPIARGACMMLARESAPLKRIAPLE